MVSFWREIHKVLETVFKRKIQFQFVVLSMGNLDRPGLQKKIHFYLECFWFKQIINSNFGVKPQLKRGLRRKLRRLMSGFI